MTLDRLHHRAGISIGARGSLAVVVGDARPEIMRLYRHEIRNADAVEVGDVGDPGNAEKTKRGARAADRGARPDRALDAGTAVFRLAGPKPIFIAALVGAH